MNIRTYLKDCFQDRAIVQPSLASTAPSNAIILHLLDGGEEIELAKSKIHLVRNVLQPTERNTLSIGNVFPPRIKVTRPNEEIPKTYIPVADWDGKNLRIAISEDTINTSIRNTLFTGLSSLMRPETEGKIGANLLRQKMSLGLSKERQVLEENAAKNRKYAEKQFEEIQKFLESAARQERIAAGLEKLEQGQLDEFAKSQWEDLQGLIPGALQDIYIKDNNLNAITNPIVISSVFIGTCRIEINIPTAKVMIYAVEASTIRQGHCHPHVQNDGNPCWGNLERNIADMAAKRDYYGLVNATLRLLHQYVHDDAYAKLHDWGVVAARPEDGMNCHKYNPFHSYAQMRICLECKEECHITLSERIEACRQLRATEDCITCKIGEDKCRHHTDRFSNCFNYQKNIGVAYCLLKCTNEECPFIKSAASICKTENLPPKEPCPAKEMCRMPCTDGETNA